MLEEDCICIQESQSPEHFRLFTLTSLAGRPLGRAVDVSSGGNIWCRLLLRRLGFTTLTKQLELRETLDDSLVAVMHRQHTQDGMCIRVYDSQTQFLGWFGIPRRRASQMTIYDREEAVFAGVSSAQIPCTFHAPADARLLASLSRQPQRVLLDISRVLTERPLDKLLVLAAALWIMLSAESNRMLGSSQG